LHGTGFVGRAVMHCRLVDRDELAAALKTDERA